jgi:hypothetical protein
MSWLKNIEKMLSLRNKLTKIPGNVFEDGKPNGK